VVGADDNRVVNEIIRVLENDDFDGEDLSTLFDHVMICLPYGTIDNGNSGWVAWAYLNHWLSVYNDIYCSSLTVGVHEIGHNLGLQHSGQGRLEYGDDSGYMGAPLYSDDVPLMCFNGAKSWQLGWYNDKNLDLVLTSSSSSSWTGRLVGVVDYNNAGTNEKVIVRVSSSSSSSSLEVFVSFNRKTSFNVGTEEGGDNVLITTQTTDRFGRSSVSSLVATLSKGQTTVVSGFRVTVNDIDSVAVVGYANVTIRIANNDGSGSGGSGGGSGTTCPHDDACNALELQVDGTAQSISTIGCTGESGLPFGGFFLSNSAWASFVAPSSGCALIDYDFVSGVRPRDNDVEMAIYSAPSCGSSFVQIDYDDDTNGLDPRIRVDNLTPASTYYVLIDGVSSEQVTGDLVVTDPCGGGGGGGTPVPPTPQPVTPTPPTTTQPQPTPFPTPNPTRAPSSSTTKQPVDINSCPNDLPCSALALPVDGPGSYISTVDCTAEDGIEFTGRIDNSAWISFVAPSTGCARLAFVFIAGIGTDDDVSMSLYSTSGGDDDDCDDFDAFDEIAHNDNIGYNRDPKLSVTNLVAGDTYYAMVDGINGEEVLGTITVSDPCSATSTCPHDSPCTAIQAVVNQYPVPISTYKCTSDDESNIPFSTSSSGSSSSRTTIQNAAWMYFFAPLGGCVLIDFDSGNFMVDDDAEMALYYSSTGDCNDGASFVQLAYNDDGNFYNYDPRIQRSGLVPGQKYYVMVDGINGDVVDGTIQVVDCQ